MVVAGEVYVYTERDGVDTGTYLHWPCFVEESGGMENITLYHCCPRSDLVLGTPSNYANDMLLLLQRFSC